MKIVADTHVHFYPCHDMGIALRTLAAHLDMHGGDCAAKAVFLTERHDCDFFQRFATGELTVEGFDIKPASEPGALVVEIAGRALFHVFAGRQIVTGERIEVLALTTDERIRDGLPAREVVETVRGVGGVPVLAWSPGKWFFARGQVVRRLLDKFRPGMLLLGDSTLRPSLWGTPAIMHRARRDGFTVLAGSDPLPFEGEEAMMGSYVTVLEGEFDVERPVTSMRAILMDPTQKRVHRGERSGLLEFAHRYRENQRRR